jgi:multidrug transporter EmrE-like cation transporter
MKTLAPGVLTPLLIAVYMAAMTAANLFTKFAADATGTRFWVWFVAGNIAGFVCPVTLTLALRHGPPHLIFAAAIAGGFCLLQLVSALIFQTALSPLQSLGIGLIVLGLFLLQWKT